MSHFLYLYPIKEYIETSIKYNTTNRSIDKEAETLEHLNKIIDKRYRENPYNIYWLTFSDEHGNTNYDIIDDRIYIDATDSIIDNGLTFTEHIKQGKYPHPGRIIDKLGDIEKLVIGGFHQADCVEKVATYSHNSGIDTFVDEDTTDNYFTKSKFVDIPLIREEYSLESLFSDFLADGFIEDIKEAREDKPWLTQK